jgi:uncharacterized damage-inducible protein DinB
LSDRTRAVATADERTLLLAFLEDQRDAVLRKLDGLDEADARRTPTPEANSLIGLVQHLGYVERSWFQSSFAGRDVEFPWSDADPDADFHVADDVTVAETIAFYRAECAVSNDIIREADSLEQLSVNGTGRDALPLRHILLHMIEETARHAGHADITRELIDGARGL